jgi:hypothetical protein
MIQTSNLQFVRADTAPSGAEKRVEPLPGIVHVIA